MWDSLMDWLELNWMNDFCDRRPNQDSQSNFHLQYQNLIIILSCNQNDHRTKMILITSSTSIIIMMSIGAVHRVLCAAQRSIERDTVHCRQQATLHCVTGITSASPHYNVICSRSGLGLGGARGVHSDRF